MTWVPPLPCRRVGHVNEAADPAVGVPLWLGRNSQQRVERSDGSLQPRHVGAAGLQLAPADGLQDALQPVPRVGHVARSESLGDGALSHAMHHPPSGWCVGSSPLPSAHRGGAGSPHRPRENPRPHGLTLNALVEYGPAADHAEIGRREAVGRTLGVTRGFGLIAVAAVLFVAACGGMTAQQTRAQLDSDLGPFLRIGKTLEAEHPVGLARIQADLAPAYRALATLGPEIRSLASQGPQSAAASLKRLAVATITLASDLKAVINSQDLLTALSNAEQFKADEPAFSAARKAALSALP